MADAAARRPVRDRPNCEVLSVALPLHPDALASDGFHPGELAYRHWANPLAARIRARESSQASGVRHACVNR
ncbi:hypothetical protein [Burkholderia stagnalis]|uniref:hypothetical protein n=1 Tax=Burkholderia stagnalis TaxID=1503054 RepID=UPI0012D9D68A|nr:hypothetical protein [Burkholderia stagnalis]